MVNFITPMRYKIVSFCFIVFLLSGCDYAEEARGRFYDPLFSHKLDLEKITTAALKKFKMPPANMISFGISNGVLTGILMPLLEDEYTYFLFMLDLKDTSKTKLIPNPFKTIGYYHMQSTAAAGKLYAISIVHSEALYSYDYATGVIDTIDISALKINNLSFISVFNNTLYYYGSLYGVGVYDLAKKRALTFNHPINVASYKYSTPSFPLSTGFNLLSGKLIGDSMRIYRVDSLLQVQAEFGVRESLNQGEFKMIAFDSGYVIANETELLLMDEQAIKEKWRLKLGLIIEDAIKISASELLVVARYLADGKFGETYLQKIDVRIGESLWKIPIGSGYYSGKHIALSKDNQVIVRNNTEFLIIDPQLGKITERRTRHDEDGLSFDLITDEVTGINYYFCYGEVLYW